MQKIYKNGLVVIDFNVYPSIRKVKQDPTYQPTE